MSSQSDKESDVQDVEIIDNYSNDYEESQNSSEVLQTQIKNDVNLITITYLIKNQFLINYVCIIKHLQKSFMLKASKINEKIMNQRKQLKDQFKEFQCNLFKNNLITFNAARKNLKDCEIPYQTDNFPLQLKTQEKFVILTAQNLFIWKGTQEQFIKTNLENENSIKKVEQDGRIAFKQCRPYQKRKFDF